MAATPSSMIPLGTTMPSFSLPDAHGTMHVPASTSRGVLIVFMCNHCPFVLHIAEVLVSIHLKCQTAGIEMFGINSNDVKAYPDDGPQQMMTTANRYGWAFPYLIDESQAIARAFGAVCTPDVFLYDRNHRLYYRGQVDDTRPRSGTKSDGDDLLCAIERLIAGDTPPGGQKPAIGCNIKWKP